MKITDLLKVESIDLQAEVVDKRGAVNRLVDLMEKSGCLKDKEAYKAAVLKREAKEVRESVRVLPFLMPRQMRL